MTKKKAAADRLKPGRPSKFKEEFVPWACKLACEGKTDKQIADFFEVDETTVNRWKISSPEFCQSLKEGKEKPDDAVERSLFERANGYSHPAEKIFCTRDGDIVRAEYTEHYPPDVTACIFWLKNRRPDRWREPEYEAQDRPITIAPRRAEPPARPEGAEDDKPST